MAENADSDCGFEQRGIHSWHCTVHDVEVTFGHDEPISCQQNADSVACSECIDLGIDDSSAILRPFGKALQCRNGHTVWPEEQNDGSSR